MIDNTDIHKISITIRIRVLDAFLHGQTNIFLNLTTLQHNSFANNMNMMPLTLTLEPIAIGSPTVSYCFLPVYTGIPSNGTAQLRFPVSFEALARRAFLR